MMLYAVIILAVLGAGFGAILAFASKKLAVETDERIEQIIAVLPGANCGACGYPGCAGLAEAIVNAGAPLNACVPGKDKAAAAVAAIMGQEPVEGKIRSVAQLHCNGTFDNAKAKYEYKGVIDCHLAVTQFGGPSYCNFGCIGLGSCARVCPFGAISIGPNRLPVVDTAACVGCGLCANQCPQKVLTVAPINKRVHIRCNNRDKGKSAREVCGVSCISCGLCEKTCPTGAITMINDQAGSISMIDYEKCVGCGACVEKCPRKCIHLDPPIDPEMAPCEKPAVIESGCQNCPIQANCGVREENAS
ncbi:MAG: RnfABCDGE type electron transport complex subunit B [Peptococcaceae bacterium]|jgi:Na+-translocating ferredoxin:NAD+ oxidoreductase RNF subunit RnfB|nr:RnfABCDGE type electron transport complex subunit B [Peptococcaceae bacterium]